MSTPTEPEIVVGAIWTLRQDLGVGVGAIPAGAEVTIIRILPPFYPGVAPVPENTIVSTYSWEDWMLDEWGNPVLGTNTRTLAYPESDFRAMFAAPADAPQEPVDSGGV